jgi:5-methylcytosine-specific restriction endonuclease McrA
MSRERERLEAHEQRLAIYARDCGLCAYCGRPVDVNSFTVAHRIARTKWAIAKYGRDVIEHPMNKATTHHGACNDLIQCTNKPVERENLATLIRARIAESHTPGPSAV